MDRELDTLKGRKSSLSGVTVTSKHETNSLSLEKGGGPHPWHQGRQRDQGPTVPWPDL